MSETVTETVSGTVEAARVAAEPPARLSWPIMPVSIIWPDDSGTTSEMMPASTK